VLEVGDQFIDDRQNRLGVGNRKRPARAEVVLDVDDDEGGHQALLLQDSSAIGSDHDGSTIAVCDGR